MSVLYRAIECFILVLVYQLLPVVIGFLLGWVMRGEKDGKDGLDR